MSIAPPASPILNSLAARGYHPVHVYALLERHLHDVLPAAVPAEGATSGHRI